MNLAAERYYEKELEKRNKVAKNAVKNALDYFYNERKGFTKTVDYINSNNLFDMINYVILNNDLNLILDSDSIIVLSQLERIYIKKYSRAEDDILTLLSNYNEDTFLEDIKKIENKVLYKNIFSVDQFTNLINRFYKLGLINITLSQKETIEELYADYRLKLEKEHELNEMHKVEVQNNKRTEEFIKTITNLYELYNSGVKINDLFQYIDNSAETFYNNSKLYIENIKNVELKVFARKISNYYYTFFLANKYGINKLYYKCNSTEELCKKIYLENGKMPYVRLQNKVDKFLKSAPSISQKQRIYLTNLKEIYYDFFEKMRAYNKIEKNKSYKEQELIKSRELVNLFIISGERNIKRFCTKNSIDILMFRHSLNIVKNNDDELFEKYEKYCNLPFEKSIKYTVDNIKYFIGLMNSGIKTEAGTRDFDIIDYYTVINIPFNKLLEFVKEDLTNYEYCILMGFIKENTAEHNWSKEEIIHIYKSKHILNAKFASNGTIIKGSGIEVSLEDKKEAISMLIEKNIPINNVTYYAALKRILLEKKSENSLTPSDDYFVKTLK